MKAKDIPEEPILQYLLQHKGQWCYRWGDEKNVTKAMPEGTPPKVALAKLAAMIRRGLIDGCTCGCRGDFEITEAGERNLLSSLTSQSTKS